MPIIKVNVSKAIADTLRVLPKRSDKRVIVRQLGAAAMQFWKKQGQSLRSSSRDYVAGLEHKYTGESVTITLRGMMPNMIERGWPGGDMRTWLLKGKNAKMGKNGMYNTVAFRHGTPGTSGRNAGRPMAQAIHNPAKRLAATLSRPGGGGALYGQRLHPDVFRMSKKAKTALNTLHRPWHSTSIYMGMIRQEKTYKAATQSQYTTFRRISAVKKNARSWYHPGIRPRHFAKATRKHVEAIAKDVILQAVGT